MIEMDEPKTNAKDEAERRAKVIKAIEEEEGFDPRDVSDDDDIKEDPRSPGYEPD